MKRILTLALLIAASAAGGCGPDPDASPPAVPAAHLVEPPAAPVPAAPAVSAANAPPAVQCRAQRIRGIPYRVCEIAPADVPRLRLMARTTRGGGQAVATIRRANDLLRARGERLLFAMNAGLYESATEATGMLVADSGYTYSPLNTRAGPPNPCRRANFYCPPNGVFFAANGRAAILTRDDFASRSPTGVQLATQSGPMLVHEGRLTNYWTPGGGNPFLRNGVGVRADGTVVFAISDQGVNFHHFATAFRDELNTPEALFLDGRISRLYTASDDEIPSQGSPFAGIFVVTGPGVRGGAVARTAVAPPDRPEPDR